MYRILVSNYQAHLLRYNGSRISAKADRYYMSVGNSCIKKRPLPAKFNQITFARQYLANSSNYMDDMYKAWSQDPKSVHISWDAFFRQSPTEDVVSHAQNMGFGLSQKDEAIIDDHLKVAQVVRRYQYTGHLIAKLDPLNIASADIRRDEKSRKLGPADKTLVLANNLLEFCKQNPERMFQLPKTTYIGGKERTLPLKEIVARLENTYCSSIGAEFAHLKNLNQINFLRERLETPGAGNLDVETKTRIIKRLARASGLESYLAKKWSSEKRFGLEGCEVLIPALKQIIDQSTKHGVDTFVIGMPHRGRLNVLANVCRKPLVQLFTQFAVLQGEDLGSGDVKYHLGTYIERMNRTTNTNIRLAVVANPSHLEAADPVVLGKTRAEQFYADDKEGKKSIPILIHGDAAFSGQGVVYETFHMSELPSYTTHGTVHVVVNNQVGFTTDPCNSRSSAYCSDVSHVVNAPCFHVNADDPDAVIHVCNIAADWRAKYHRDVIIDLVCYRRNGHNEIDEPRFTQPRMYEVIRKTKPVLDKYAMQLEQEGVINANEFKEQKTKYERICEESYIEAQSVKTTKLRDWLDSPWKGFFKNKDHLKMGTTGVDEETLVHIGTKFSTPPPDFEIHKGLERIFRARLDMVKSRTIDWALGEALAFGSLLKEGVHVRLSGQDVERGTFSHRHHILHHQTKDKAVFDVLNNLYPKQAHYTVCNSSLSEFGVLGFELGYSMVNPNSLVMWEAQFGDFFNTAQCIIDQFIASGEQKWVRQSGLVMLLPHAMEGMGPEHSSARLERFLIMSDDDADEIPELDENTEMKQLEQTNWIVANCSTPANYMHLIRRQIALPFRKSLILMTPKLLLRHPDCKSSFDECLPTSHFQSVIPELNSGNFKKLVFCSGKTYYDLTKARAERNLTDQVAIARLEQFTPFPYGALKATVAKHDGAEVIWAQEEHKNFGGWGYVQPRLENLLKAKVRYAGRAVSASPATGAKFLHSKENREYFDSVFN
ncbi:unnamed protein product [Allacma fusca]|uniref:2-oxoglutarate dehydrogenase, mitochondrial n=1 Tax=Allacma fusca TaxID=39272 RepID=A0A8J2KT07_9HEXA|nr:unnamed protein product [Allacma fusca]